MVQLLQANVIGILSEAPTTHVWAVFSDEINIMCIWNLCSGLRNTYHDLAVQHTSNLQLRSTASKIQHMGLWYATLAAYPVFHEGDI